MSSSPDPVGSSFVPVPARGRTFTAERRVRWGDVDRRGRLRLDSLARYLQDVANDDTRDAGHDPMAPWVVRRTVIETLRPPALGEVLALTTFSGGLGARWAERRTSITGADGGRVEAAAIWIYVDPASGRPARLGPEILAVYAEAAGGRKVNARLTHARPGPDVDVRDWPLRSTDHDPLGHVNNAATWEAVEDELERRGLRPGRAEVEYGESVGPDDHVALASAVDPDGTLGIWLTVDDVVRASAVVHPPA